MRASRRGLLLPAVILALLCLGGSAETEAPAAEPTALLDRLETAWARRDLDAYLALWDFAEAEERQEEKAFAASRFAAEETRLILQRPASIPPDARGAAADAQIFAVTEPRGRVEQWRFFLEKRPQGWVLTRRDEEGQVDGLVHLSLDPNGVRADGITLRLEDFEIRMVRGTLFTPPRALGPTALLFVGEGQVRVYPRPPAERDQLRQFCGKEELVDRVRSFFARIHPADLSRVLSSVEFRPDPDASRRFPQAQRIYRSQAEKSFVLDATTVPRSPWWLLPSPGDAMVTFETARRGTLTFTVSGSEPEDINLFDREAKRQICLYPSRGRATRYGEDDVRSLDVLRHDLQARFEPQSFAVRAEDTLLIRTVSPSATVRLHLDDALRVDSVTSREGGRHLFFRVRNQNSIVVSLGPLTGFLGEIALTVRYAGVLNPGPIESEILQAPTPPPVEEPEVIIENVLVYTNRSAWYPRAENDDHTKARLRLDVPQGFRAVSGGELRSERGEGGRTVQEYRQEQPGKYLTAVVGRFADVGMRQEGAYAVRGFGLARTRGEALHLLPRIQDMLDFYAVEFGACPYPSLNVVVTEARTPGGHAPPGMVLLQQRPPLMKGRLQDDPANFSDVPGFFLAHELAHQWWGHGVAGQNYRELWLSEGAAQYAAALWVRSSLGEDAFRDLLGRMAQWAMRHNAQGPINLGYRLGHLKRDPQIYRSIVYDKGAYVLHMLRAITGDDAFRRGVTAFMEKHRYGKAGTEDLREALEEASAKHLSPYFREWIYGTTLPRLRFSSRSEPTGEGFRTVVAVRPEGLPGPVPLEVFVAYEGGSAVRTVSLAPEGGTFTVETPGAPRKVEINRNRALLASISRGLLRRTPLTPER